MMIQSDWQSSFGFFGTRPVLVEPSAAQVSTDAGLLPIRQLDEQLGLTRQFAEALTDRRAVVTNRPGASVLPGAAYDAYADRGESENRNKELKCGLQADRLSDHRYFANLFRLYPHALAYNLLNHLRRLVVDPPAEAVVSKEVPAEALAGRSRRCWYNHRRAHDPLGEGQPCTWRTRLIKVAARVYQSARRVVVELSSSWPYLQDYQKVSQRILDWQQPAAGSG